MTKKYLNTLIALLLLAATWGAITFYDKRKAREAPKTETTPQQKILSVEAQHIQGISFIPRSGEGITCRREGANWTIVEPQKLPADQSAFSTLLTNLTGATVEEVVDPHPSNLKDFGLDPPQFTLQVTTDAKPPSLKLLLGDDTPTSGGIYAQVAGDPRVITLASYLKTSLEKKLFDLRDRRALTLDADQIQKIQVDSKGQKFTLEKNPEGVWDLNLPPAVRADRFAVEGMVSQLRGLTMQSIASDNKKKTGEYGLAAPELRLELKGPGGSQSLVVGKKDKEGDRYFAMNSALEPVFTLSSSFVTDFKKKPEDLREKDLFSFSSFEVNHLEVNSPKGHWVLEKQKDKWKETSPKSKDVPTDKVESLLSKLRDFRADSFPKAGNLSEFGLTKPAYRFSVRFGDKNQTENLEASRVGDHIYARRSDDPLPSELSKTALDGVDKALDEL
jgi:hypothetical protein